MFDALIAKLKAEPKTIVFTEGPDARILEATSKLLSEGIMKVVLVGNVAEVEAAGLADNLAIRQAAFDAYLGK